MRRRGLLRTSAVSAIAGLAGCQLSLPGPPTPNIKWKAHLSVPPPSATLAFNKGSLYVETSDAIAGLDPDTGDRRWAIDYPTIAGVHDDVLFVAGDGSVAAVPASGVVDWTVRGRFLGAAGPWVFVLEGNTMASDKRPVLRAHAPDDGTVEWRYHINHPLGPGVQLLQSADRLEAIYLLDRAPQHDGRMRVSSLDPMWATKRWTRTLDARGVPRGMAGVGGILVGTSKPDDDAPATVTGVAADGTVRWQRSWDRSFAIPRWAGSSFVVELAAVNPARSRTTVVFSPLILSGETIFRAQGQFVAVHDAALGDDAADMLVLLEGDAVVARSMDDGTERHRVELEDYLSTPTARPGHTLQAVAVDGQIYVTSGRRLLAVTLGEGVRWTFQADHPLGVLGQRDGIVYVGTREAVFALDPP